MFTISVSFLVCDMGDFRPLGSQQRKSHGIFMFKPTLLLLSLVVTLFCYSCDNNFVSHAEYDAALSLADSLEAQNDELQFELSDLKLYNDYLEKKIDSLQKED